VFCPGTFHRCALVFYGVSSIQLLLFSNHIYRINRLGLWLSLSFACLRWKWVNDRMMIYLVLAKFAGSVGHPMTKMLSASGGLRPLSLWPGALPLDPAGGSAPDPHYTLVLRTRHGAPNHWPLPPPMSPTELCPGTSNRKSAPMIHKSGSLLRLNLVTIVIWLETTHQSPRLFNKWPFHAESPSIQRAAFSIRKS